MARSYESIEGEIAQARDNLAATLDEIADRMSPKALANQGKQQASELLKNPAVIAAIGGVAALLVGGIVFGAVSKKRKQNAIERYLAAKAEMEAKRG